MPCVTLAVCWPGAAAKVTQVLWSSLGPLPSCHKLLNRPKGSPEKEKQPLPAQQPSPSPSFLVVQKEKCGQTASSYSSWIQTVFSQALVLGRETFSFRVAVQNKRWRQCSLKTKGEGQSSLDLSCSCSSLHGASHWTIVCLHPFLGSGVLGVPSYFALLNQLAQQKPLRSPFKPFIIPGPGIMIII